MWTRIRHLLEMIRFSHTIFALPFALLSAVMAWTAESRGAIRTPFDWKDLLGILVCMVGARSAAMAFNRLADRKIDAANPRTAGRHIPAGTLSVTSVIVFMLVSSAIFFAGTLFFLPNKLPVLLSVPVLIFLLAYSFTKRFTSLAHFWLGASLMLAPICVWIALRGEVLVSEPSDVLPALLLGAGVLLWVSGFDIIYACQDYAFDLQANLKSIPARIGVANSLRLAAVCHLLMIAVLLLVPVSHLLGGPTLRFGWIYVAGIILVAALLLYEHSIVRADDLTRVNVAFFNVNSIVSLGLFAVGALDLLW